MTSLLAGKYELLRCLARGGMAEVHLARQVGAGGFEKLVVVKRILPHFAGHPEFVRMFLEEARLAADLRHPNVVQLYEVGEDDGAYFMVMELLKGASVADLVRDAKVNARPIAPAVASRIVVEAAAALHYAHNKSDLRGAPLTIIHRDVSPQNLFVTQSGATKLLDFGIAKAAASSPTTAGGLKGKYAYMSPEQAEGETLTPASDQFALAVVLHELLSGEFLFAQRNDISTLKAVRACMVPSLSERVEGVSPALDAVLARALSLAPGDRFATCDAFATALEEAVAPAPPSDVVALVDVAAEDDAESALVRGESAANGPGARTELSPLRAQIAAREREAKSTVVLQSDPSPALEDSNLSSLEAEFDRRPLDDEDGPETNSAVAAALGPNRVGQRAVGAVVTLVAVGVALAFVWNLQQTTEKDEARDRAPDLVVVEEGNRFRQEVAVLDRDPHSSGGEHVAHQPASSAPEVQPKRRSQNLRAPPRVNGRRTPGESSAPATNTAGGDSAVPTATAPVEAAPIGTATLRFPDGNPFWLISVDGKRRGVSPQLALQVDAGPHQIELSSPDGKIRHQRSVVLAPKTRVTVRVKRSSLVVTVK